MADEQLTPAQKAATTKAAEEKDGVINALTLLAADKQDEATEQLVKDIETKFHIYTTRNDERPEMWIYFDGIYVPQAQTFVREFCRERLGLAFRNIIANQVIAKIEADTYIETDKLFAQGAMDEIPVQNGLFNIRTRELSQFTSDKIFFAKLPVTYDKTAACPTVDAHFKAVLKYAEDVPVLYELFGYCLLKEQRFERAFMFLGEGRNGKGKTLALLKSFLGAENCSAVPLQALEEDQFAAAELFGKLANICGDLPKSALRGTGTFKTITGRDMMSLARKFLPMLHTSLYAKLIFSANELPRTCDHTRAFWDRWTLLEFPYTFVTQAEYDAAEDKTMIRIKDEDILAKLATPAELSGLLNASLDGLDRLEKNRAFSHSKSAAEVEDLWIRRSDSFAAFWKDCLTEQWDGQIEKSEMRRFYSAYCRINKLRPISDKIVARFLADMGVGDDRYRGAGAQIPIWVGCVFKDSKIFGMGGKDGMGFFTYSNFPQNDIGQNNLTNLTKLTTFTNGEVRTAENDVSVEDALRAKDASYREFAEKVDEER